MFLSITSILRLQMQSAAFQRSLVLMDVLRAAPDRVLSAASFSVILLEPFGLATTLLVEA